MTDVANKLWSFCHTLRHDGIDYGDYIEQITYLLFLKMADERELTLPKGTDWAHLRQHSGTDLSDAYVDALRTLGKQPGILGDIYSGAQSRFSNPVNLKKLISLIDETEWTTLDVDVKAAAFEGLLEKAASEGKKGAGQYFTPRVLIQSIVRCMKPDPRASREFKVGDPACGTGGFLVCAYEWLLQESRGALDRAVAKRVRSETYYGNDLVARPRRLALMNLYLHQVVPHITGDDSIYNPPNSYRFDLIMTNPPFGSKGANQAPSRDDFAIETSNKQLNFLQHVLTILKPGGRAAVVVPDHVLFAEQASEVLRILMEDCDLHTILRCPRGTFTPYSPTTNTYVLFFSRGRPTERVWFYDNRAGVEPITKQDRPLTRAHFEEFERCYGPDPYGLSARSESDCTTGRWRVFSAEVIVEHRYKLDSFKWMPDDTEELEQVDPAYLLHSADLTTTAARESLDRARKAWSTIEAEFGANSVKLDDVIVQHKEQIHIDDSQLYKRCRVQLHARGIVLRDEARGASIKTKRQQVCRPGQFLVAEIDAKVGGFGIVPPELDGAIVSSHYFLFDLDRERLLPGYLSLVLTTDEFQNQVKAQGTTNYAAIRPRDVLTYEIPLPDLRTQEALIELAGGADNARQQLSAAASAIEQLARTIVTRLASADSEDEPEAAPTEAMVR